MNAFAPPTVASVIGARFPYFKCKYKTVAFASTESNTIFFAFIFFAVFFPLVICRHLQKWQVKTHQKHRDDIRFVFSVNILKIL